MIFGSVRDNFDNWIEEEECKCVSKGSKKIKKYFGVIDLEKYGNEKCKGCRQIMIECHDSKYGMWYLHEVIVYVMRAPSFACTNAAKKSSLTPTTNHMAFHPSMTSQKKRLILIGSFPQNVFRRTVITTQVDYIENVYQGGIYNTTDEDDKEESEGSNKSNEDVDKDESNKKVGVKEKKVE